MTPRTPQTPDEGGTQTMELTVPAQMRDSAMNICNYANVRFAYDPSDPYALELEITEMGSPQEAKYWTGSREVFAAAALWGIELPGLDMSVSPVTVTRATPGQLPRDVPCLRITLREVEDNGHRHWFTGRNVFLDIARSDVLNWLTMTTQVVRIGQEHRYVDVDAAIADILGPSYKEGS